MEYRILGPLELVDDGRPVVLSARKQRALLVRLLLRSNEVVSADALIDAVWGEQPPSSAAKLVQVYVSQLRRTLGDAAIETRPAGLRDARRARAARRRPLRAAARRRAARRWRRRTRHWRRRSCGARSACGADGRSRTPTTRTSRRSRSVAWPSCASPVSKSAWTPTSRWDATGRSSPELASLVAEHPLRDRLRAQLMLALYRCGRQADALDAYQDAARVLRDELGLEPGAQLRDLEHAILNHAPWLDAPAPPAPSATRDPRAELGRSWVVAVSCASSPPW